MMRSDDKTSVGGQGLVLNGAGGEAFNRALTRIWIGDKPVQPDLK
jgi:hypothetical protein